MFKTILAAVLPPMELPKAPKGEQAVPGFRNQVEPRESAISKTDRLLATSNRLDARTLQNTNNTVRALSKSSPDLSGSVTFMQRTGIPENFTLIARDMDGKINPEGTKVAQELIRRLTFMGMIDGTFNPGLALQSLSEQLAMELQLYGAMGLEVALDKALIPSRFVPVHVPTLKFYDEEMSFRIVQEAGGEEIDLDIPTFFYVSVDQLQNEAYASSYLESAVQPILTDLDFNNDLRRILKRHVFPRMLATIDSENVKKTCPPEILSDPQKWAAYKNALITEIQTVLNGTNPEDAIVTYDTVDYDFLDPNQDPGSIVERIQKVLNGKLTTGAKTLPVILGHNMTSNASSTEAMLYVKQADMIRRKLNEIYSRAFTVAVRLLGMDVYVEFKYDNIDLRPESELEAFRSMKQSRILELCSLGYKSDEETCIELTGNLPPDGFTPLSGTFFKYKAADTANNPNSNTSAIDQTLTTDTPKAPKSQKG